MKSLKGLRPQWLVVDGGGGGISATTGTKFFKLCFFPAVISEDWIVDRDLDLG